MSELPTAYEPQEVEKNWYQAWLDHKCFSADAESNKEGYSIVIPPPNVTGVLHLGHVLNNTIQDLLARRARQNGKEVLWLPGTDHAGIATQTKVEKKLREEDGKSKHDVGREEFLKRIWDWKDEHGGIIIAQLKRLGCSCDWDRERFTMDADYSKWVTKVFTDLFKEGLIYRGKRMVNWCPKSLTALSDEEVIMKPKRSKLYFMKYEIVDSPGEFLEISTTRPETLMGDIAVAVHPEDERFKHLVGKKVRRPFPQAEIAIITDDHVDIEFGTGCLKITPAHDKADFEIGQRHNLEIIDVLHPDGTINCPSVPELDGLDRFQARRKAAEMLDELGLLIKVEEYDNNVGFSERADVVIEPRISMQWFLKYPCVDEAKDAVANGEINVRPARWAKTYDHWLNNIQDWCISRQLWWGHQIPVWYKKDKAFDLKEAETLDIANLDSGDIYVGTEPPEDIGNWERDADVMDTWFSSWLWPFATMNEKELEKFYPTADLVTGPDIIFFWVARMIMAGFRFKEEIPFKNVYFNALIRDKQGRKMSKSLGNSPDPIEIMESYGADGLRFALIRIAPVDSDIHFIDEKCPKTGNTIYPQVEEGRNFANKLYNAARFRQMQSSQGPVELSNINELPIYHLSILNKLDQLGKDLESALANYRLDEMSSALYEFFWTEYCDHFLEAVKGDFRSGDEDAKTQTLATIDTILSRFLAYLHPLMPHITEELSAKLGYVKAGEFLMNLELDTSIVLQDLSKDSIAEATKKAEQTYDSASKLRNLKAEYNLAANKEVSFKIKPSVDWVDKELSALAVLVGANEMVIEADYVAPKGTPATVTDIGEVYMPLDGLIDVEAEKLRLNGQIEKLDKEIAKINGKLGNENFVARAPDALVAKERQALEDLEGKKKQLLEMLTALG